MQKDNSYNLHDIIIRCGPHMPYPILLKKMNNGRLSRENIKYIPRVLLRTTKLIDYDKKHI